MWRAWLHNSKSEEFFYFYLSSLTLKLCANKLRLWAMKAIQLYQLQNQFKKEITKKQRSISDDDAVNCYQQFVLCIHVVRSILYFPTKMVKFCKANVLLCYLFNIRATPGDMETAYPKCLSRKNR